jgi:hypothetical protein
MNVNGLFADLHVLDACRGSKLIYIVFKWLQLWLMSDLHVIYI